MATGDIENIVVIIQLGKAKVFQGLFVYFSSFIPKWCKDWLWLYNTWNCYIFLQIRFMFKTVFIVQE